MTTVLHNAGVAWMGPTDTQPASSIDTMLAVNAHAPIFMTRALLPFLRTAGSVHAASSAKACGGSTKAAVTAAPAAVVFVSSVLVMLPTPKYTAYNVSKCLMDSFAWSLRLELQGSGVAVHVVRPGATKVRAGA